MVSLASLYASLALSPRLCVQGQCRLSSQLDPEPTGHYAVRHQGGTALNTRALENCSIELHLALTNSCLIGERWEGPSYNQTATDNVWHCTL